MNLKWIEKDDKVLNKYYSLRDDEDKELAYIYFHDDCWSFTPTCHILQEILGKKFYRIYTEKEVKDAQFHAMLDIQSKLNMFVNICANYSNAISDYVTKYLEEFNNEN